MTTPDELRRQHFADAIAAQLVALKDDERIVIALEGPWGSGKTWLLERVAEKLDRQVVVRFNPWLVGHADDLVERFLDELVTALVVGDQLQKVGRALLKYKSVFVKAGAVLDPTGVVTRAGDALDAFVGRQTVFDAKASVASELVAAKRPVVVFIDDIDRLQPDEIREVMRLVRVVGDLPAVRYVLAYEPVRVALAVGDGDVGRGRDYLQKMVELAVPMPAADHDDLGDMCARMLLALPGMAELEDAQRNRLLNRCVFPFISTPREVERIVAQARFDSTVYGADVAVVDVVALAALRITVPGAWSCMGYTAEALVEGPEDPASGPSAYARRFDAFVEAFPTPGAAQDFVREVFPAAVGFFESRAIRPGQREEWWRERRVANVGALRTYLTANVSRDEIPRAETEALVLAVERTATATIEVLVRNMSVRRRAELILRLPAIFASPANPVGLAALVDVAVREAWPPEPVDGLLAMQLDGAFCALAAAQGEEAIATALASAVVRDPMRADLVAYLVLRSYERVQRGETPLFDHKHRAEMSSRLCDLIEADPAAVIDSSSIPLIMVVLRRTQTDRWSSWVERQCADPSAVVQLVWGCMVGENERPQIAEVFGAEVALLLEQRLGRVTDEAMHHLDPSGAQRAFVGRLREERARTEAAQARRG